VETGNDSLNAQYVASDDVEEITYELQNDVYVVKAGINVYAGISFNWYDYMPSSPNTPTYFRLGGYDVTGGTTTERFHFGLEMTLKVKDKKVVELLPVLLKEAIASNELFIGQEFVPIKEATRRYNICRRTIYNYHKRGYITAVQFGGKDVCVDS